jgi:imidazolonepropionase-like amidohydrolase
VKAVVDEAHVRKLPVVAHAHRPEEIRRGLAAGVDDFEHTGLATAPGYPDDILKAIAERTAKMNVGPLFWCPTIEGFLNYGRLIDNPESLDDPAWKLDVPNDIVEDIKASIRHPGQLSYYQITPLRAATVKKKFHQLQDSGVVLLVGTDSGIPMKFHSSSTWHEMDAWVHDLGVDPMATIRAATYWPAVMMKVDKDYGSVSEGKFADIIAVKGDVLRYIDLLQRVDLVIKHGRRYNAQILDTFAERRNGCEATAGLSNVNNSGFLSLRRQTLARYSSFFEANGNTALARPLRFRPAQRAHGRRTGAPLRGRS